MIPILKRINSLAKKQREDGLTQKEKEEQQQLRQEYLKIIRGQVLHTFSGLTILDPLGNDVTPEKLKIAQQKQMFNTNDES
ncbi:DUF896 domain-containing protein [Brevibacillus sp. HB1.2]|uniref:DUF896 domain-containing protein n=1 Tax=Brevibacillus TaxID=55080 RepID=UPI00036EEE27|nr:MULTISPECIES: DUF896 domain-containing protein [unclassified Brevibacillus]ATF13477.1 DUF896 family protein [Brevibacillus brevis X23]NRS15555.1 DUF896 domain-containing protein [Brevibacillus sp. HB1.4B]NTU18786.1 DUF896 domain-containing protein [Brevibacillus sp. HB1.2]